MKTLEIKRIGAAAVEAIQSFTDGVVFGVTSKGAFLRLEKRIIYLTALDYLSPFNLTLAEGDQRFEVLQPGDAFYIENSTLIFPSRQIQAASSAAVAWVPPKPVPLVSTIDDQNQRADRIGRQLSSLDATKGYLFLARPPQLNEGEDIKKIRSAAEEILTSFRKGHKRSFLSASSALLGSGSGLTPSGDDFLTGFFLYHFLYDYSGDNRRSFLNDWWQEVTNLAFERTTTISANRLLFAERGWSEDIFLKLLDHLFDPGVEFPLSMVQTLMRIGHSSGVDTFTGILYGSRSML
jgi:hypothetical protein